MSGAASETENSDWTQENLRRLFAAMKETIPKPYIMCAYSKTLGVMDWTKVAFPPFSPEACKEKWAEILQKMRKFRSLTELIDEAENGLQIEKYLHPDAKEMGTGVSEKPSLNLPSDSEDEDIEYSSSEEEVVSQDSHEPLVLANACCATA
ncbi:hypothetical protein INR49_013676 [Caranx melampygus]|nr:hypothetical protein INR49_013676 [Caranx melampygus]